MFLSSLMDLICLVLLEAFSILAGVAKTQGVKQAITNESGLVELAYVKVILHIPFLICLIIRACPHVEGDMKIDLFFYSSEGDSIGFVNGHISSCHHT